MHSPMLCIIVLYAIVYFVVETNKKTKKRNVSKKRKLANKEKTKPSTKKDVLAASPEQVSRGWSELIPTELLLIIFQRAMKQIFGSKIPFLCR